MDATKKNKISRTTMSDQVYEDIKRKIQSNEWLPGDRLPSENDIALQYHVSRMTARTALQKLVVYGILEVKNGGGYFVKDFEFSSVVANISCLLSNRVSYDDFNHFRFTIEKESIKLLRGKTIKPSDLKILLDCCTQMERASDPKMIRKFAEADYHFHQEICRISGNTMFQYSYELIKPLFLEYFTSHYDEAKIAEPYKKGNLSIKDYFLAAVEYHKRIVDCIRNNNTEKAIEILKAFTHMGSEVL